MANQSGSVYGLTILSPIIDDPKADTSHDCAIRDYLAKLDRGMDGPFAKLDSTHMARLVVMDDVVFVVTPAREEHLRSKYLVFESNFDGDLMTYLTRMATEIPEVVEGVWRHCVGYPGVRDPGALAAYMKKCQLETTFFFADVNDQTVSNGFHATAVYLDDAGQPFGARFIHRADRQEGAPTAQRPLVAVDRQRRMHMVAGGDQHAERRVEILALEIAVEGVGEQHDLAQRRRRLVFHRAPVGPV